MLNQFTRRLVLCAMSTTALGAIATPALANDQAPAAATSNDSGTIIVSARRRNETLQSTPVAITAINTAMLEAKGSTNLSDLQGAAPGLLITQQNSGAQAANLSIRGLTYADIEKSQTPTVGVVVDGVTIGTNTGQLQDVFDIGQIEVLRGPQGTLFGANTIGGVILIDRTKPTMETGGKAEFSYGQWNTWSGKALVNFGDGANWGVKAWYYHNQSDGYYYNINTHANTGGGKDDSYGASLLYKPAGSGFDGQLTVENLVQSFTPVNSTLTTSADAFSAFIPAAPDLYTVSDQPTHSSYHAPAATLKMNYDAGGIKLTSITGWRHTHEDQTQDFATDGFYYVLRRQHYTQFSQELRAAGKITPSIDYVVGGYYFSSHYDLTQWTGIGGGGPALNTTTTPSDVAPGEQVVHGHTQSYAMFGDFNWAFAHNFRLTFGGRWSHDIKKLDNGFYNVVAGADTTFGLVGSGDASFSKFTPKVGIDWRPDRDTMVYASWSRGYRSGGFSPRAATAETASTPFQPETVDSYEIGGKFDLLDRKLQVNLAAFMSDYKNMQQNLTLPGGPTGNQTITGNVPGGALIKGIEADATLRPTAGLKLTATAALTDSHFRHFVTNGVAAAPNNAPCTAGVDCTYSLVPYNYSANNLIYAPKFSGSISAEYTMPTEFGKVVTSVGLRHISPYDEQISIGGISGDLVNGPISVLGNAPRVRTGTQNLLDAAVTFDFKMADKDAYLRVFGRNLANTHTTTAAFTVAGLWGFGSAVEPRTYGATVGVKF